MELWGRSVTEVVAQKWHRGVQACSLSEKIKNSLGKKCPVREFPVLANLLWGLLRTLSLCTCCRHYPGAAAGRTLRSASPSRISLPRKGCRVGLRIVLFEDCSAFTRVTACTLALSPYFVTPLPEGFSHFVTSMTAPIASGWSGAGWGSHPLESAALSRRTPQPVVAPRPPKRPLAATVGQDPSLTGSRWQG